MIKRSLYLDVLKGVNIILVILGHCIQFGSGREYSLGAFFENPVFKFIYSFHMPMFMLISGYLFGQSVKRKNNWKDSLLIKFKQLIIPLCSWSVISLLGMCFWEMINSSLKNIDIVWIIKKFLSGFIYGPWFLWAIWWCSLVILFVSNFLKDRWSVYILLTFITFIIPDVFNMHLYKFMWPFFLIGYKINACDLKKIEDVYRKRTFVTGVFVVFMILLYFYNYETYIYTSGYYILNKNVKMQMYNNIFRFLIGVVGSVFMSSFLYHCMNLLPKKLKEILGRIGKNTMGIYIISGIIFDMILPKITMTLPGVNYLCVFIETIGVLIISIVVNRILKNIRITNVLLLGGR